MANLTCELSINEGELSAHQKDLVPRYVYE